jgi:hypothetical protein
MYPMYWTLQSLKDVENKQQILHCSSILSAATVAFSCVLRLSAYQTLNIGSMMEVRSTLKIKLIEMSRALISTYIFYSSSSAVHPYIAVAPQQSMKAKGLVRPELMIPTTLVHVESVSHENSFECPTARMDHGSHLHPLFSTSPSCRTCMWQRSPPQNLNLFNTPSNLLRSPEEMLSFSSSAARGRLHENEGACGACGWRCTRTRCMWSSWLEVHKNEGHVELVAGGARARPRSFV